MQAYLDSLHLDLHVHLEHSEMGYLVGGDPFPLVAQNLDHREITQRRSDFSFIVRRYERQVNTGADIGVATSITRQDNHVVSPGNGTLGCWLKVKTKSDDNWKTVALTCYHTVRPAVQGYHLGFTTHNKSDGTSVNVSKAATLLEDSDLWTADKEGLTPERSSNCKNMEHPTRAKHTFQLKDLRQTIADLPGADRLEEEQRVAENVSFFDQGKQILGKVWLASGYLRRTPSNGRLNWALVFPTAPGRVGVNRLPSKEDWVDKYLGRDCPRPGTMNGYMLPHGEQSVHELERGDRVFKTGAATTCSVGRFNEFESVVVIKEERYMSDRTDEGRNSREYSFIGVDGVRGVEKLGKRGDAESVVWDKEGRMLGFLFASQVPHGCDGGYSLVIPIEDVLDDIVRASGGDIVDIRVLVPSEEQCD